MAGSARTVAAASGIVEPRLAAATRFACQGCPWHRANRAARPSPLHASRLGTSSVLPRWPRLHCPRCGGGHHHPRTHPGCCAEAVCHRRPPSIRAGYRRSWAQPAVPRCPFEGTRRPGGRVEHIGNGKPRTAPLRGHEPQNARVRSVPRSRRGSDASMSATTTTSGGLRAATTDQLIAGWRRVTGRVPTPRVAPPGAAPPPAMPRLTHPDVIGAGLGQRPSRLVARRPASRAT